MSGRSFKLRAWALLAVGAPAVHELRYLISYGGDAQQSLGHHGHAYLAALTPLIGLAAAFLLGGVLASLAGRRPLEAVGERWGFLAVWSVCVVSLIAIYGVQELVEGWLAPGHPVGLEGVVGHGGWVAFPLAVGIAAALTVCLRGAEAAQPIWVRGAARVGHPVVRPGSSQPREGASWSPAPVLARHLGGRAPPLPTV